MSRRGRAACGVIFFAAGTIGLLIVLGSRGGDAVRTGGPHPGDAPRNDEVAPEHGPEPQPDPRTDGSGAPASTYELSGACVHRGAPVPGATVLAHAVQRERQTYFGTPIAATTDEHGRYAFDLSPGLYVVFARNGGRRSARARLQLDRDLEQDLVLDPGPAALRVKFAGVEDATPEAVGLAVHNLLDPGAPLHPDAQGACVLRDLHPGELCKFKVTCATGYFVRPREVWAEGKLGDTAFFDVWIEGHDQETVVQVGRFARVRGRIRRPEGASSEVTIEARMASGLKPRVTVAANASAYEIQILPGKACALFPTIVTGVDPDHGLEEPVVVPALAPGEVREVDLSLAPLRGRVHGSIVAGDGAPVPGARIRGSVRIASPVPDTAPFHAQSYGKSDASGAFVLTGVPRGVLHLHVDIENRPELADPVTRIIEGVGGGAIRAGTIVAPRGATLKGRITGVRAGAGSQAVHAAPRLPDGTPDYARWRTTRSNERGEFAFARLAPGDHLVYVGGMDYTPVVVPVADAGEATRVTVPARNDAARR